MALRLVFIAALLRLSVAVPDTGVDRCVVDRAVGAAEADLVPSMHLGLLQHQFNPLEPAGGMKADGAPAAGPAQAKPAVLAEGSEPAGAAGKGAAPNASLVAKQLPGIIGNIAGNILGDVAEGLIGGLASAVSSGLDPLDRILEEAVNSTNHSVQVLLDKLASADLNSTEMVLTFQAEVGAVLNTTTELWERISGVATTAVNVSTLALNGLGQEELASQISLVLGNIISFVDNLLNVVRQANGMIVVLGDVIDDELVRQLFRVNETLFSVAEQVSDFEATIASNITSFITQAESSLGLSNSTALDPIEQELNQIVSLISTAVQTVILGVSDAVVLVMTALDNDSGLNVNDILSRLRSGAPNPLWSFTVMAVAAVFMASS